MKRTTVVSVSIRQMTVTSLFALLDADPVSRLPLLLALVVQVTCLGTLLEPLTCQKTLRLAALHLTRQQQRGPKGFWFKFS